MVQDKSGAGQGRPYDIVAQDNGACKVMVPGIGYWY